VFLYCISFALNSWVNKLIPIKKINHNDLYLIKRKENKSKERTNSLTLNRWSMGAINSYYLFHSSLPISFNLIDILINRLTGCFQYNCFPCYCFLNVLLNALAIKTKWKLAWKFLILLKNLRSCSCCHWQHRIFIFSYFCLISFHQKSIAN